MRSAPESAAALVLQRDERVQERVAFALGNPEAPVFFAAHPGVPPDGTPAFLALARRVAAHAARSFARPVWPGSCAPQLRARDIDALVRACVSEGALGVRGIDRRRVVLEADRQPGGISAPLAARVAVFKCRAAFSRTLCGRSFAGGDRVKALWGRNFVEGMGKSLEVSALRTLRKARDLSLFATRPSKDNLHSVRALISEFGAAGFPSEAAKLVQQAEGRGGQGYDFVSVLLGAMASRSTWLRIARQPKALTNPCVFMALVLAALDRGDADALRAIGCLHVDSDFLVHALHSGGFFSGKLVVALLLRARRPLALAAVLSKWRTLAETRTRARVEGALQSLSCECAEVAFPARRIVGAVRLLPTALRLRATGDESMREIETFCAEFSGLISGHIVEIAQRADRPDVIFAAAAPVSAGGLGLCECELVEHVMRVFSSSRTWPPRRRMLAAFLSRRGALESSLGVNAHSPNCTLATLLAAAFLPLPRDSCSLLFAALDGHPPASGERLSRVIIQAASAGNVDAVHFIARRALPAGRVSAAPSVTTVLRDFPVNCALFSELWRSRGKPSPWEGHRRFEAFMKLLIGEVVATDLRDPASAMAITIMCVVARKLACMPVRLKEQGLGALREQGEEEVVSWLRRIRRWTARCSPLWSTVVVSALRKCVEMPRLLSNYVRTCFRALLVEFDAEKKKKKDVRTERKLAFDNRLLLGDRAVARLAAELRRQAELRGMALSRKEEAEDAEEAGEEAEEGSEGACEEGCVEKRKKEKKEKKVKKTKKRRKRKEDWESEETRRRRRKERKKAKEDAERLGGKELCEEMRRQFAMWMNPPSRARHADRLTRASMRSETSRGIEHLLFRDASAVDVWEEGRGMREENLPGPSFPLLRVMRPGSFAETRSALMRHVDLSGI